MSDKQLPLFEQKEEYKGALFDERQYINHLGRELGGDFKSAVGPIIAHYVSGGSSFAEISSVLYHGLSLLLSETLLDFRQRPNNYDAKASTDIQDLADSGYDPETFMDFPPNRLWAAVSEFFVWAIKQGVSKNKAFFHLLREPYEAWRNAENMIQEEKESALMKRVDEKLEGEE
jgi:hypothetical protein